MATLGKIVYDVRESVNEFSDDTELDDSYIIFLYGTKRAKYLRQDLNNYQKSIDNSIRQTFCLGLEEVPINECGIDYDCGTILRTVKPIPIPLELHTRVAITSVKPTTRISVPFNFVNKEKMAHIDGAPFSNSIYAYLDTDNYIYVYSKSDAYKAIECITITGIFEDPLALKNYKKCCDCSDDSSACFDEATTEYPLQPHYIDLIREEIVQHVLRKKQIPEDRTNDSTDII